MKFCIANAQWWMQVSKYSLFHKRLRYLYYVQYSEATLEA